MLKAVVGLLLLVNLALGAVLLGWLPGPNQDEREREPHRLQRQVQPEVLTLTAPGPVPTPAPGAGDNAAGGGPAGATAPPAAASSAAASAPQASASGTVGGVASAVAAAASGVLNAAVLAATGAGPASAAASAVATAGVCLQTSPLAPVQMARLEAALGEAGWTPTAWRRTALPPTTRYLVLMGPYPSAELMQRKQRELARRKVAWTELAPAPDLPAGLAPGLSLGRHDSEAAAEAALRRLNERGVRSARVVSLPPVAGLALLKLPSVSPAQQTRLARLPLPANASWQSCD